VIWIGVFFQLVLMVMDIAQRVPMEMLNVAYTLGASRWTVFSKVFLPATLPEVVDALRITMDGPGRPDRGRAGGGHRRHRLLHPGLRAVPPRRPHIAAILTIGLLGLITDGVFALLSRWAFPYVEKVRG